ncbi:MAG TPA: mannose-6-phosphate isomerase, class I [Jatrophihabitans sp.]|nr:mannose-6-phosphate isomerase, class I [Jatrophihabitans sp.]
MTPRIIELDNPIRDYAWGSPTAIPQLLGLPPSGKPAAELWIGAHPDSPSRCVAHADQPGLDALIATDPAGLLGPATVARFGERLPFLLKVLAAERALSIQVHPDRRQAELGFAAEDAAGIDRTSSQRNYRDANHKPEMAYAITEFQAFCGFRPVARTAELLTALEVPELAPYLELLRSADGLRTVFTALLTLAGADRRRLIEQVVAGCRRLAESGGEWAAEAQASVLAAGDFGDDIGPVIALLLNYVRLAPGEAIFLGAGNVHAYLRGVCVELLANSDNVLRCGLTPKHIDVPELVRIADFTPMAEPRRRPSAESADRVDFRLPVPDFQLSVCRAGAELPPDRPWLVLAGEQPVTVTEPDGPGLLELPALHAAFVTAGPDACRAVPSGRMFLASVAAETP